MTTAPVIDISSWQHPNGAAIDWAKVKAAGYVGVMIKCSQGTTYKNPFFVDDATDAITEGLLVGAYHYATPAVDAADEEAAFALMATSGVPLDLGLALDFEDLGGKQSYEVAPWAEAWFNAVHAAQLLTPFYVDQSLLAMLSGAPWGNPLWIADPDYTYTGNCWMRQNKAALVPGIVVPVDTDTFYGVRGVNPAPLPPPPAPPAPQPVPVPPQPDPAPPAPPQPPTEVTVNVPELSAANPGPTVVNGAVKALQATLSGKWEVTSGATGVDGRFGPSTELAVKTFQNMHGLTEDGIVGPATWTALLND